MRMRKCRRLTQLRGAGRPSDAGDPAHGPNAISLRPARGRLATTRPGDPESPRGTSSHTPVTASVAGASVVILSVAVVVGSSPARRPSIVAPVTPVMVPTIALARGYGAPGNTYR